MCLKEKNKYKKLVEKQVSGESGKINYFHGFVWENSVRTSKWINKCYVNLYMGSTEAWGWGPAVRLPGLEEARPGVHPGFSLLSLAVSWKASFLAVISRYWIYLSYSLWQGWYWKAKTCWIAFIWLTWIIPVQSSSPNSSVCQSMWSRNQCKKVNMAFSK